MIELNQHMFPLPESHYATSIGPFDKHLGLSILAFHISIVTHKGNQLRSDDNAYFFSDSAVPLPRPCTVLSWDRICRVGRMESRTFVLPFLPSLREDDEVGQAIAQRGSHVPSLSRRHSAHIRDDMGRINWGAIYTARKSVTPKWDSSLIGKTQRSNLVEALIVSGVDQHSDSAQLSIRDRLEFLARHGLIYQQRDESGSHQLPPVRRLLFRILSDKVAADWAYGFNIAWNQVVSDPKIVESDYKLMLHEILEARIEANKTEAQKAAENRFGDTLKTVDFF